MVNGRWDAYSRAAIGVSLVLGIVAFAADAPAQTNQSPTAVIVVPAIGAAVGWPMPLVGTSSTDPDGDALTYSWGVVAQPVGSVATIQRSTSGVASFTPDRAGTYGIELVVSDGALTGTTSITFTTTNSRPIANAGAPQSSTVGTVVTLDGSGSTDPDGDGLTYQWSVVQRPAASTAGLSDPAAVAPTFTIDAPGDYVFQLQVADAITTSIPATVALSTGNSPPTANAGPDQSVASGALVTLSGQASTDPNGDPLSYTWTLVQAPSGSIAVLASANSVAPSFTADRRGAFVVRLTATDPAGARASDDVTVSTSNSPPVASAGLDQSVDVGVATILNGSGSTDVDGDALAYSWSVLSQPPGSTATLSATNVASPAFSVDRQGNYVLQLLVSDGQGGVSTDTVLVVTANARPVANAGPDQSTVAGRTVTLNGSGSSDPDLAPLTYAWALLSVPLGSAATLSDPTAVQPTFVADMLGTYVAQLAVSDGVWTSLADTVSITTGNTAPVADAGADPARRPLGGQVQLDGIGSSDADGHSLTYSWALISVPAGSTAALTNATTRTPVFTPDLGGDYVVQLIVNDGFVNSSPDTVLVSVNTPPVANAGADLVGAAGAIVALGGSGTDADNDALTFAWTLIVPPGSSSTLANASTATPSFVPDVAGVYTASLVVNDGFNDSVPDDVVVTVTPGLTLTPSSNNLLTLESVTLTVSASQAAGPGGLAVTLASDDPAVASAPASVTILQGQTTTVFDATSATAAGSAVITASAAGSAAGTATVTVSLRGMTVTLATPTVIVNQTVAGTVTLTQPAPAGGVTVALGSSNPAAVTVQSPSVTIAAGGTSAGFSVYGMGIGAANVLASAPGFVGASAPVTSTLTLTLGPAPFDVERAATRVATLSMNGPAPAGGLTVTLSSDDPSRATVPASVTVPAGFSIADFDITGVAEGSTTVRATAAGVQGATLAVTVIPPSAAAIDSSPASGEGSVAVTRETILRFSRPISNPQLITPQTFFAQFGGAVLPTRIHVAPDRRAVTLFYLQTLPASARVRVQFQTNGLVDDLGVPLDGDADGQPGGLKLIDFDTLTLTTLPGTAVVGRVFASKLGDNGVNTPLAGVVISVDGLETTLRTTTDAMGNFTLNPAPVGEFFVHIDGRAATNGVPVGAYYPVVGKKWESKAQQSVTIADVFLPLVEPGTLQPVSQTQDTVITFPAGVISQDPRLAGVTLTVPADSLYADSGARGGMVGIAPVAPDRIPSAPPPGLNFPIVITVQTDGATNFDRPVPVCFPNLIDPVTGQTLGPGQRSGLWSFDHDLGDWTLVGAVEANQSGSLVCSEPSSGILAPGWHGTSASTATHTGATLDEFDAQKLDRLRKTRECYRKGWDKGVFGNHCDTPFQVVTPTAIAGPRGFMELQIPPLDGPRNGDIRIAGDLRGERDRTARSAEPRPAARWRAAIARLAALVRHATERTNRLDTPFAISSGHTAVEPLPVFSPGVRSRDETRAPIVPSPVGPGRIRESFTSFPTTANATTGMQSIPLSEVLRPIFPRSYWRLTHAAITLRGRLDSAGRLPSFLPPRTAAVLAIVEVQTRMLGTAAFTSSRAGSPTLLPDVSLSSFEGDPDTDGDGLPDAAEDIVGTLSANPDSDGDGVNDWAEVLAGSNPMDNQPVQTGILATADTPGTAVDVAARNDIAVVADSGSGISVLNVAAGLNPVIVAQVDTPGTAQAVAFEGTLVAVADGAAGLAIVDIGDPPAASIVRQLSPSILGGNANAVTVAGSTAYVGLSVNTIVAVDLTTGAVLETVSLPGTGGVHDVAIERDTLYALTGFQLTGQLHAIPLQPPLQVSGSVASAGIWNGSRWRLFAGGGIAYGINGRGYNTFSLAVPGQPSVLASGSTGQLGWKQIVSNGSGLGLAAVGPGGGNTVTDNVSLYDVSDPTQTNAFITEFDTPGAAAAVSIYNGFGYVADSLSGLHVLNYMAFDRNGVAPTISLESNFALGAGLAEEGKVMRLTALVDDDVQVRNVEFFVNGVRVARDGNFPFEYRFLTSLISVAPSFTVHACASDTGGNQTCTTDVTVTLVQDAVSPTVRLVTPTNGSPRQVGSVSALTATFSESMDPASVSASTFQLFAAGPDGLTDTADDVPVTTGTVSYNAQSATAILSFPSPLPLEEYRAVISTGVSDLVGLPLNAAYAWTFDVRADKTWISDTSGDWSDATKWSGGSIPQSGDFVVIDRPAANVVVTVRIVNSQPLSQLRSEELIDVQSTLTVQGPATLNGGLTLSGHFSTLGDVTVSTLNVTAANAQLLGTGRITVQGHTTLTGGIIFGPRLVLGSSTQWSSGNVFLAGGSTIENPVGGTWTIDANASLGAQASFGGGGSGINAGTIRKAGLAATQISVPFDHSGSVDVQSGTLTLTGTVGTGGVTGSFVGAPNTVLTFSNYTFGATSSVVSQGTVRVSNVDISGPFIANQLTAWGSGAVVRSAAGPFPTLRLEAGGLEFRDPTPVTVGNLQFEGGSLAGSLITTVNTDSVVWNRGGLGLAAPFQGTLNVAGQTTISYSGSQLVFVGQGTLRLGTQTSVADVANFRMGGGATIINPPGAVMDLVGTVSTTFNGGSTSRIENQGTLRKTAVGVASVASGVELNNSGVVDLQDGSLYLSGGGTSSGTFASSPATTLRLFGATTFASGSQVQAAGAVEIGGPTIVAGTFSAGSVLLLGSTMDFQNQTPVTLGSLQFEGGYIRGGATTTINAGSVVWNRGGLGNSSSNFQGTLNVSGQTTISNTGGLGVVLFGQGATVRLGTLTTLVDLTNFYMSGTTIINPPGGVMELVRTVTLGLNGAGSTPRIENQGTLRKSGVGLASVVSGLQLNNSGLVDVQQGSLHLLGGGTHTGSVTTASGTLLRAAGATFASTSSVVAGDTVELSGTVDGQFSAPTVVGIGNLTFNSTPALSTLTVLSGSAGTVLLNAPSGLSLQLLDMQQGRLTSVGPLGATNFNWAGGVITGPSLSIAGTTNLLPVAGTVAKSLVGTTLALGPSTVVSAGVVVGHSGTVSIVNGAAGAMQFNGSATLCGGSGSCTFSNAGTLQFGLTSATLTVGVASNSQSVGNFINTGTVGLRLAGATLFDKVVIKNAVTLGGTLDVSTINGFVPSSGQIFSVLTYGSRTGVFGTINGNGETYTPTYGATALTLTKP